jgi:pimeloyl-ACP methyl ester carboxylesterase
MSSARETLEAEEARFRDGFYTVRDGLRLHFRDYPGPNDQPPLLCLPGLTRNARDFETFAERWSPRFRVIAVDFRGRGESDHDPDPARYVPLTYAHDTIALLDHLGVADAIFVGTSLGGLVTMLMAVLDEDRVAATILNDVGPELEEAGLERIRTYVGKDRRFADWDEAARAVAANGRGFPRHYDHADWLRAARRLASERDGDIRFDYDMAIAQPFETAGPTPQVDMWPLFRALAKRPLLVIRGADSDLIGAAAFARMRDAAPAAEFVEVPGVGHAPDLDEPAALAAVESFLARLQA